MLKVQSFYQGHIALISGFRARASMGFVLEGYNVL